MTEILSIRVKSQSWIVGSGLGIEAEMDMPAALRARERAAPLSIDKSMSYYMARLRRA